MLIDDEIFRLMLLDNNFVWSLNRQIKCAELDDIFSADKSHTTPL